MKKRCLAPILAVALLLSACGKAPSPPAGGVLEIASGLSPDTVLLTVDGREVTAGCYLYWLADACDAIADYYADSAAALDWSAPLETGTLADYALAQAADNAALYATVETWAAREGCALTETDRANLAADWDARAEAAGGETDYLRQLERAGLDRAGAEHLAEDHYLYVQLCNRAREADSPLAPAEGVLEEFFQEGGWCTAALLTLDSDAQTARDLFSRLNKSADPAAEFQTVTVERGGTFSPKTFQPGDGTLPDAFADAAAALTPGQCSGIVESQGIYGMVLRCPPDEEAVRDVWFDARLQDAASAAERVESPALAALSVASFWTGLSGARAALDGQTDARP